MKTLYLITLTFALTLATALPELQDGSGWLLADFRTMPTNLMPSPTSRYDSDLDGDGTGDSPIVYPGIGKVLSNFRLEQPSGALPPPLVGAPGVGVVNFTANWEEIAGGNVQQVSTMARAVIRIATVDTGASPTQLFDVEMLELSINGGGNLPAGMMVRESPTLASTGQTTISGNGSQTLQNGYRISSFFDIFTELSVDGGQN